MCKKVSPSGSGPATGGETPKNAYAGSGPACIRSVGRHTHIHIDVFSNAFNDESRSREQKGRTGAENAPVREAGGKNRERERLSIYREK